MVMDFAELQQRIRQTLARYDHQSWNDFLEFPSVENICALLHQDLKSAVALPVTLRVWEGDGKWAEL
jgi:6-pyruvoyltetrahydropterin/6-carboxytetrahydropterin synthase